MKSIHNALRSMACVFAMFLVVGVVSEARAQDEPPKVCITQETADRCSKAFDEVVDLRAALKAALAENEELKLNAKIDEELQLRQRERIVELEKERGTTVSFLWGLIKIKKRE